MTGLETSGGDTCDGETATRGQKEDWRRRRGTGSAEREWNEPWERLRFALTTRYPEVTGGQRRWERPDADDPADLALLLRQASTAVDADVTRLLAGRAPRLSPTELDTLRRVARKPSAGVQLSEYLRVCPARVSRVLDRLERAGLVVRTDTYLDGRVRRAAVTDDGLALLRSLEVDLSELARQQLDHLEPGADRALVALVAVLADLT